MEKQKILIADADEHMRDLLRILLVQEGYRCKVADSAAEALEQLEKEQPELLLLSDITDADTLELCMKIRRLSELPIILLTVKTKAEQGIAALENGADDYIFKPFNRRDLLARVKATLRRGAANRARRSALRYTGLDVDMASCSVQVFGNNVKLTGKELELLWQLATHPGEVFSRSELLRLVWEQSAGSSGRTVDTHIKKLRQKLKAPPDAEWSLSTVWGIGYKFEVKSK